VVRLEICPQFSQIWVLNEWNDLAKPRGVGRKKNYPQFLKLGHVSLHYLRASPLVGPEGAGETVEDPSSEEALDGKKS